MDSQVDINSIEKDALLEKADGKLILTARICLLSFALFAATFSIFVLGYESIPRSYIFTPIAVLFGISALSAFWLRSHKVKSLFIYLQLLTDMLAVTGAIYLTGAVSSPLVFLYLPLIMAASILLERKSVLILIALSAFSYFSMSIGISQGLMPTADGGPIPSMPTGGILLHMIGLISGMILVSFLSSYLQKIMRSSAENVEKSKRDLAVLSSSQRELEEKLAMQDKMARLLADKQEFPASVPGMFSRIVGTSPIMQKVFTLIEKVANTDATVLINGESGTGKELVARAIHSGKNSGKNPFIAVNCGAIPENLIESQLFGHKKGAFTGADSDYSGLFLQADGGTIFLDEIGELPLLMQTKLLRVLQEKTIRPIGGAKDIPIDVRIIAATNRTLKKEVELGNFREDLFYRLNVISIRIPSLRARKEDIPLLVRSILRKLLPPEKEAVIAPGTMDLLMSYDYPGNVRELENILERTIVLGGEVILPEHLPSQLHQAVAQITSSGGPAKETNIIINENVVFPVHLEHILDTIERKYLELALIQTSGAKKRAAELLGINFRSFRYRLQKYGIESD
jgi:DNA-binding NtrC family response regulator